MILFSWFVGVKFSLAFSIQISFIPQFLVFFIFHSHLGHASAAEAIAPGAERQRAGEGFGITCDDCGRVAAVSLHSRQSQTDA
jgi:hypothetical protein